MMAGENAVDWSHELDCLRFSVPGHGALCAMHRLAFKALMTEVPTEETCRAYFIANSEVFLAAARSKIERMNIPFERSLHINSRDLRRSMSAEGAQGPARLCRVLDR
ncbi:hypothetical protein QE369_004754 [Agrobacterium larrymoorei]|uniref:DUF1488 domain-containing protein n=2 Tax=Agrobacterium larrymoorei TaxID=160699 RepID=A0AAJ2BGN0_9HYPH|nr:hypothetical protein [Agrobacterium larrymoorei]